MLILSIFVKLDVETYYNPNKAPSPSFVQNLVTQNIQKYSDSSELNQFGARFKYSKFQKVVDSSNESITSNITTVKMRRDMQVRLNTFAEYELCFGNRFYLKNHGHSPVYQGNLIGYNIKSSGFTVSGISGTVYLGDKPTGNLEKGTLFLFKLNSPTEPIVVKQNVGVIDYKKGEIRLNPINVISTQITKNFPIIEISAVPFSNDVIGLQDLYLQLDVNNTTVSAIADNISSGNDVSGTNYIVSSSYGVNSLIRGNPVVTVDVDQQIETELTPTATITPSTVSSNTFGRSY